jgi:hypothetical protein
MLRAIKRLFRRRRPDLSKTPDRMLDWTDPWERSEGIMRLSNRAAEVLARKMFQDYPPTLGILPRSEELSAMTWAIKPMFIHVAMERMWDVWDKRSRFAKLTAYYTAQRYHRELNKRKTEVLQRTYPLLRQMEEEQAIDMIEKLLERFNAKLRVYDGSRTFSRDSDRSTFHRMALHVATQFYRQKDRPQAQRLLVEAAKKEAGMFVRKM